MRISILGKPLTSVWIFALLWMGLTTSALAQKPILKPLDEQSFAAISAKNQAHLDVRVKNKADLKLAVQIYTGKLSDTKFTYKKYEIKKISQSRAMIPYFRLSPKFKMLYLKTLWPNDELKGNMWHHRVTYAGFETLWSVSQWFTGTGQNHRAIQKASGLRSSGIKKGRLLKIPADLLFEILRKDDAIEVDAPEDPVFSHTTPVAEETRLMEEAKPRVTEANPGADKAIPKPGTQLTEEQKEAEKKDVEKKSKQLEISGKTPEVIVEQWANLKDLRKLLRWSSDNKGKYASYRLKAGEAIYSAVVVRFCGLVRAEDVNRLAKKIITRNGIKDETDLAIGTAIRIPYEDLEPEFKADNDPEYLEYVRNLHEVSLVQTDVLSRNLEGVHIILDPGHGGRDPGASQPRFGQVWEDDFVYDIACRIKARLEKESAAKVVFTLVDPSVKYKVQDVRRFKRDRDEVLLTSPRFKLDHPRVATDGVNLRWVLANHRYQEWLNEGVKPENVLFASLHADSLHHAIRGSMIYVPDARSNQRKFRNWANRYRKYKEFKGNQFTFKSRDMKMAQARSMAFASNLIDSVRRHKISVHKQKPIRTVIHRNRNQSYVPAVVKYNRIPTRCLIEVCNLNNKKDRELMKRPEFRQQMADAFVDAVYKTYGVKNVPAVSRLDNRKKAADR